MGSRKGVRRRIKIVKESREERGEREEREGKEGDGILIKIFMRTELGYV